MPFVTEKKIKSLERQVREKDVKYRDMRKEFEKGMRGQYFSETHTLRNVGAKGRGNCRCCLTPICNLDFYIFRLLVD